MGKKKSSKSTAKKSAPARKPIAAPKSKTGGKKRTSEKTGGALSAVSDVLGNVDLSSLPALPSFTGNGAAAPKISFHPQTGQMRIGTHRRRSRKGLSASDIKGFMRVNKFAGMMTKVTGKKHVATPRRRRKTSNF